MGTVRYHTNDRGQTLPCSADLRACSFVHGATPEEASERWQSSMAEELIPTAQSTGVSSPTSERFPLNFRGEPCEALSLDLPVDPASQMAIDRLIERGFSPLVAGGAVRDGILGNSPKDFDIEVHGAEGFDELRSAVGSLGPLNLTGKAFGVMKLRVRLPDGELSEEIDLSLPRRDSKVGDGHRGFAVEVDPKMSIREATSRRDLTVNALLWNPETRLAMDFHGGFADMENGVLRHVSPAFSEDPLRVIRIARFAAKLGFDPAPETVELSRELRGSFDELPSERISGELSRMILEPSPERGFSFLRESGWGDRIGVSAAAPELSENLSRGLKLGEDLPSKSEKRVLQLSILGSNLPGDSNSKRRALSYFSANKSETTRALAISSAPSLKSLSNIEAKQWAWDNQAITARDRILHDSAVGAQPSSENPSAAAEQFKSLNIFDGPEPDGFDSTALIRAQREANPGLKSGPWIRDLLQEHRTAQYSR